MEAGTRLYHGTSSYDDFNEDIEGPAWFSEGFGVAKRFADLPEPAKSRWKAAGRHPRILIYKTDAALRLLEWRTSQDIQDFVFSVTESDDYDYEMIEIADMVCSAGYDGWIIPANYPEGSDILLCSPSSDLSFVETTIL